MIALPPLASEPIFSIGSFGVTNTYINSTIAVVFFLAIAYLVRRRIQDVPHGIQNFFEFIIETLLGYADQVTGSRKKSLKVLPIFGALFLFILLSNWVGIIPGIGSIGFGIPGNGFVPLFHIARSAPSAEFVPLFRPANTDLNMTLAMAVFSVILSHILGVALIGFWRYGNKFIKFGDVFRALKSGKPVNVLTAAIEFGVGLIEVISEVAKMISLSLRLFGNVFAGEVLLTVLAGLISVFVPLPFMALELLVGVIQATVFAMLVLVYISMATMPLAEHGHDGKHEEPSFAYH